MAPFAHRHEARRCPATFEASVASHRLLFLAFIAALAVPGARCSWAADVPVVIRLYTPASVHRTVIDHIETETSRVFAAAHFELRWEERAAQGHVMRELQDPIRSVRMHANDCATGTNYSITVQITDRFDRRFRPKAVGFSLPFAPAGVRVTIFYDRVALIASNSGVRIWRVLAAMLSHEIGHILIGTDGHGETIMRPEWDSGDFQALSGPLPAIDPHDASLMHRHIAEWQRSAPRCRDDLPSVAAGGQ